MSNAIEHARQRGPRRLRGGAKARLDATGRHHEVNRRACEEPARELDARLSRPLRLPDEQAYDLRGRRGPDRDLARRRRGSRRIRGERRPGTHAGRARRAVLAVLSTSRLARPQQRPKARGFDAERGRRRAPRGPRLGVASLDTSGLHVRSSAETYVCCVDSMEIRYDPRNHPLAGPSNSWSDWTRTVISCHQLIDFCLDYVEGVLPDEEQQRFRRHLSLCPDCVRFFETYRRTPEVSREALKAEMPESVRESVRSYLRTLRDET
jgi:hypothetical protein